LVIIQARLAKNFGLIILPRSALWGLRDGYNRSRNALSIQAALDSGSQIIGLNFPGKIQAPCLGTAEFA